ncbi:unnamed protein product [Eruca vesicaria subsp. sativa]|uniref:F-box protein At3g26010-like beta-propeller domain-containing protein n=1 Tax=Eruca vesicaria subsp. sativa TaxID=29727 RepID=A0ABC8K7U7_ERUVS|nr:unnamed protein product [Eruca vesicaria subsp. sativa]
MGFHGCDTWDLPKSLASYIPPFHDLTISAFASSASSNGLVLMVGTGYGSFVGNPLLQQWVEITSCPYEASAMFGLVTRLDEDRVVLILKS